MIHKEKIKLLDRIFQEHFKEKPAIIKPLPLSGSNRQYFRLQSNDISAIGAINDDKSENEAFIYLSCHFKSKGLNVPEVFRYVHDCGVYLVEDLGEMHLFDLVTKELKEASFSVGLIKYYEKTIQELIKFQIDAKEGLDFSKCYPVEEFNEQSVLWDLNYFKYYCLKLSGINFNEQTLENDFQRFAKFVCHADKNYFMYRDFQARNVLIKNDSLYFIDYQGGRKGPLQYDLASLLFQAKAEIPDKVKDHLIKYYLLHLKPYKKIDEEQFLKFFYGFVALRILQTLGAYGFRGFYERKGHFIQSMPLAIKNIEKLVKINKFPSGFTYLEDLLLQLSVKFDDIIPNKTKNKNLTVIINSFSYKKSIPVDYSENGGGFVFDCRALPNPALIDEFKHLTGLDPKIIKYFKHEPAVELFIENCFSLISGSVERYLERGFTRLMVSFGCTGGQHRSVYCAERTAERIKQKYTVNVEIHHKEITE